MKTPAMIVTPFPISAASSITARGPIGRRPLRSGPRAVIEDAAEIGNGVTIMAGVFIGHARLDRRRTWIHPNATLYHGVRIGKRCVIHANVSLGSDGFGWAPVDMKKHILLEMLASGRAPPPRQAPRRRWT